MRRKRYFQWLAGDFKGEVVGLESISQIDGETFYNFDDGESCNLRYISKMTSDPAALKEKFMVEVENPYNIWGFETIQPRIYRDRSYDGEDEIPTLHDFISSNAGGGSQNAIIEKSDVGTDRLVPPKKKQTIIDLPKPEDFVESPVEPVKEVQKNDVKNEPVKEVETENEETPVQEEKVAPKLNKMVNPLDPVAILVDSCKKHPTDIPVTLTIDLPMKTLYHIADSEFDDGGNKFINYIVEGMDITIIIEALKCALKKAYGGDVRQEDN